MRSITGKSAAALLVGCLFGVSSSAVAAGAAISRVRVGAAAKLPMWTAVDGRLASSQQLQLNVALQPRNPAALQAFATAVSTPGNPAYGHFLNVSEFAGRFGATPAAIDAVDSALRAAGLSVGAASANNLMIPVSGTAGQINNAMSTDLSMVQLPSGRRAYANLQAPALPATVATYVQGVIGLDNVAPALSAGLERLPTGGRTVSTLANATTAPGAQITTGGPQPSCSFAPNASNSGGSQTGYSYDELAAAYGFSTLYGQGDLGQGQSVALVELEPFSSTDVQTFQACYGTSATVTQVNVGGGPANDDDCNPGSGTCSDGEAALDIETIIGIAPKATVLAYEGPDTTGIAEAAPVLNQIVSDNTAKVISTSFGVCEAATPAAAISSENTSLQEAAAQGQSFFSAAGDSGSETCSQLGMTSGDFSEGVSVEDPAGQPFATGVGGTELFTVSSNTANYDDTGADPSEVVWDEGTNPKCNCGGSRNDGFGGGGGGGISKQWPMPSYQSSAASSLDVVQPDSAGTSFCGQPTCREVPDVSANADGSTGYITYTSNSGSAEWAAVGGTSAASPLWAAFMALVNDQPACRGLPIGFANPALYSLAGSAYGTDFHDTQATSTLASALGEPLLEISDNDTLHEWGVAASPNTSNLYPVLAGYDMATGLGSMQAGPLASSLCAVRAPVYTVSVTSPGAQTTGRGVGVSLQLASADSGSQALHLSASGLPAGLSMSPAGLITGTPTTDGQTTVTISALDAVNNAGSTTFTWNVVTPGGPKGSASGKGGKLSFKLSAGSFAPAFGSVTIKLPKGLKFGKTKKIKVTSGGSKVAFKFKVKGGTLTLTFSAAISNVSISFGKGSIKGKLKGKAKRHAKVTVTLGSAGISETSTIPLKL
jgi:subtilase family serine protease